LSLNPTLQSNEAHETVWGRRLSQLNEMILMLWEHNMRGDEITFRGRYGMASGTQKIYDIAITGKDIGGWYKNRIKWPSAIRTDDPVYVQNHLQQLTATPFPALSLYTYLEEMGVEDVEAEIDRIGLQLEDARFHPDRMTAAVDAMSTLNGAAVGGGGQTTVDGAPDQAFTDSMEAGAVPNQPALAAGV
jgi:hypothetical protein